MNKSFRRVLRRAGRNDTATLASQKTKSNSEAPQHWQAKRKNGTAALRRKAAAHGSTGTAGPWEPNT